VTFDLDNCLDILDRTPAVLDALLSHLSPDLTRLRALGLAHADFDRTGTHPHFGAVTLRQLLATWAVHDLNHLMQIARVMAKQIGPEVGPWEQYLKILRLS